MEASMALLCILATTNMCHVDSVAMLSWDPSPMVLALQAIMCSSALLALMLVYMSMAGHLGLIFKLVVEIMFITSFSLWLSSFVLLNYLGFQQPV